MWMGLGPLSAKSGHTIFNRMDCGEPMAENVNFHDATLVAVRVNWADGTCIVEVDHWTLGSCFLTFSAMSHLTLPQRQDWGRSVSINSFSMPGSGQYEIEMQSGDLIRIEASDMTLTTSAG
jgi:hypothetical protein